MIQMETASELRRYAGLTEEQICEQIAASTGRSIDEVKSDRRERRHALRVARSYEGIHA
jgi:hypothetical protein